MNVEEDITETQRILDDLRTHTFRSLNETADLIVRAADEIDRLRDENEKLRLAVVAQENWAGYLHMRVEQLTEWIRGGKQ
jgi:DNA-binding transcriptional regulator YiaG